MEHIEVIPFPALVAGMLLCDKELNYDMISEVIGRLYDNDIYVDEENYDLSILFLCVDVKSNNNIKLKDGLDYDFVLYDGITVYDFLLSNTIPTVISFLEIDNIKHFNMKNKNKDVKFDLKKIFGIKSRVLEKCRKRNVVRNISGV